MIHTYKVTGMTCGSCSASVEEKLSKLPNVNSISIDLEKAEARIVMKSHIPIKDLQQALPSKYQISELSETNVFAPAIAESKSELKQLFPLFLIFIFIFGAAILLNIKPWDGTAFMLDFMGLFYIVFSFFKFLDLKGFPDSFKMYDPLAMVLPVYGWIYPFVELTLGLAFLTRFQIEISLIVTLVILGITTIGVSRALLSKNSIQCACLGTALKLPMTKATFIENSIMIIMALIMLIKIYI